MTQEVLPPEGPNFEKVGSGLFNDVVTQFVEPELNRRLAACAWDTEEPVYLFQVLFHPEAPIEVRLNREVHGEMKVTAARAMKMGEEVAGNDFTGVDEYRPLPEDADIPHVTGIAHRTGWSLAFEFGYQHPRRHEFLKAGQQFAGAARTAREKRDLGVAVETAFSAAELLAKAELLSAHPTIDEVVDSTTHGAIATPYSLWAHLDNTDPRFARLLHRLTELRGAGRYLKRELDLAECDEEDLFQTLADMEEHVAKVTDADHPDRPRSFNVIATQDIKAGQLVSSANISLTRPKNPPQSETPSHGDG